MKSLNKTLPFLAILTLVGLIIAGYLFVNRSQNSNHYLLVPNNATNVIFVSPLEITKDFIDILKRNPTILDSVCDVQIDLKEIKREAKGNGINLLEDVVVYTFIDSLDYKQNLGVILSVYNQNQFLSFLTNSPQSCLFENYKNGEIITLEKEKVRILHRNETYIVLHKIDKSELISTILAKEQFDKIFGEQNQPLSKQNKFFEAFAQNKNHIGVWVSKENEVVQKYTALFNVFEHFSDHTTSLNALDSLIKIHTQIDLIDQDFYVESSTKPITLNKAEIGKISLITKPKYVKNIMKNIVPKQHNYLLDYCVGGFCSSIIGYKNAPVFTTQIRQRIDPETFETIQAMDTVELSPQLNIPEVMTVVQIKDMEQLLTLLQKDTLATNTGDFWTIPNPLFVNEVLYLKVNNNLLYIGSNANFDAITPEFTTFGICFHLPKSIDNYPPKNAFQRMGMSMIPEMSVSTFNLNFEKIEDNKIFLKGNIKMVNDKHHSLIILTGEILKFRGLLKGFI